MKIDLKFAGVLVAGAVVTSALVLVVTGDGGDEPGDTTSGADPFPAPAPTGGAGPGPAPGPTGAAGENGVGTSQQPQSLPLPESQERIRCPEATVTVKNSTELQSKLNIAEPGEVIRLAPGTYKGQLATQRSGAPDRPIHLCGTAKSVLDGGDKSKGYGLHLDGASHWRLIGFTVQNSQKGVMLDGSSGSVIQGLTVRDTGDEAIHLRRFSTGNSVQYNTVTATGRVNPRFGEGVYLGSSHKNWDDLTKGQPDRSDNNLVAGNRIQSTAEAVDIKEGTTGGKLVGNVFDGSKLSGDAINDSWVDAKGNNYVIEGNKGAKTPMDGFQTHEEYDGWGTGNTFRGNVIDLGGGKGVGINLTSDGNTVACDNKINRGGKLINKGECS